LKKFTLLFFLLLCFCCVSAQTLLIGKVVGLDNQLPIELASVTVSKKLIKTDSLGVFQITLPYGKHLIRVSAVGYKTYERKVELLGSNAEITIEMEQEINQLDQFVFTGGKIERKAAQEIMSMNVIRPNLIAYSNANDLGEVVNKVPGVSMIEGQISMRGGVGYSYNVGSRVMVLLDDMPLMGGDLGDVRWSFLPIEAAEQIEVVKGATSVLYGSAALNGSINVRTGWPTAKPETKITMFQGIYDNPKRKEIIWWERTAQPFTSGTFFSHKQQLGNFDVILSGNFNMTRSYLQENDEYRGRTFLKTRYRFKKIKGLSVGVNSMVMLQKAGRFFLWADLDSGAFKPYDGSVGQDFWRIYTIDPHITYENPNKKSTHSLKMRNYDIVRFVDKNLNRDLYNAHAQQYSLDYNYQQKFLSHFTSTVGFFGSYITAVSNVYEGRYKGVTGAVFGQLDYMKNRLGVTLGSRYERNKIDTVNDNRRPMFKVGANYKVAKKTFLRANYGEGYRFPTIAERYVDDGVSALRVFPNPALQTEFGWTAEFGVKQGFKIGNWNGELDYAFFWQEYTDLIEFRFNQYGKPTMQKPMGDIGFKALNIHWRCGH
jgi:outer membrane receptor protein involved in Fe transport